MENAIPVKKTLSGQNIYFFGEIEFVKIPAGKFLMGSTDSDKLAANNQKPQHVVDIPYDYWMARYPVTNRNYAKYVIDHRTVLMLSRQKETGKGKAWLRQ